MSPADLEGCTLLLVDDEEANLDLLEAVLASEGYRRLARVSDARQVGASLEAFAPDLVLLDLHMPHRSGFEVLQELRLRTRDDDFLPVLVLTADVTPEAKERALTLGARDFVTKPFDTVEVLLRVRNLLEARVLYRVQRRAAERASLLADASRALGASLDTGTALQRLTRVLVPRWAEVCAIDLLEEGGVWRRAAAAAGDWVAELALPDAAQAALDALLAGDPPARLGAAPALGDRLGLPEAGAWAVAPMRTGRGVVGLLTLGGADAAFRDEDPGLAAELARRAALAVENARLFSASQAAARSRDRVLATVAHDLRNPLAGARMGVEMMLEMLPDEGADYERASLQDIHRSTLRMDRMIEDLLDIARMEAGTLTVRPREECARALLAETVRDFGRLAAAAGVELALACSEPLPVLADGERVLQVLANLVGNAVKFTPRGGTVTLGGEHAGGAVQLSVGDTGPGIPAEQIPFLFSSFWQANAEDRRGVGLGLSIAQALVQAHGGRIWAESRPGAGAVFRFTLPAPAPLDPEPLLLA